MRIVHLSSYDNHGGAAIAAHRLNDSLRRLGVDSRMLVGIKRSSDCSVVCVNNRYASLTGKFRAKLDKFPRMASAPSQPGFFSTGWAPDNVPSKVKGLAPELINIHWVGAGFLRVESLARLQGPLVWTMHDMWAFCGAEHYSGMSERYIEGYTVRNRHGSERGFDVNRWVWERKRRTLAKVRNLTVVTPSKWLANCVEKSELMKRFRIEVIPNGLDHLRFQPVDRKIARDILGLPTSAKLVLFGAVAATSDIRKGFHHLRAALKELATRNADGKIEGVIFGASKSDSVSDPVRTYYLGTIIDEISMPILYSAADVFVAPSIEDNLPNTVMESLACGTPVVAFDIGGMPDMIEHKRNGYLVDTVNGEKLAEGIRWVLDQSGQSDTLSRNAREKIVNEFRLELQAQRYRTLYEELLSEEKCA